jgi:glycine cleavage system H protein
MARVEEYEFPADRWYDRGEHLWVRPGGATAGEAGLPGPDGAVLVTIGLDALGQEMLGEVVYLQLVEAGVPVRRGEPLGTLEAEKMVRPLLAPVTGTVLEVNPAVLAAPRLLNSDPYEQGWVLTLLATRWTEERQDLLHDETEVAGWARAELEANA